MPHLQTLTLTLDTAAAVTASADQEPAARRVLSGVVLPFGVVGRTSAGPVSVAADADIRLPADLARVKLVDEHQVPPRPIGYGLDATRTDTGLSMSFHLGATPAADAALQEAAEKLRDAFSVELYDVTFTDDGTITAAALSAVALVTVPAFSAALVETVAASHNPEGIRTMTETTAAPAASDDGAATTEAAPAAVEAARVATVPAMIPAPAGVATDAADQVRPVEDLYAAMSRVLTGTSRPDLEAALSDITGGANLWTAPDQYAGQLWSGMAYTRRFVPLLAPGSLTSYKGTGWRWVVEPEVDDYAGDKAAVPSNAPTTEAVPYTAARLAGAHDIDRKYVDFGDTEFLAAYYEAMTTSYARKSDAKALAFIIASAAVGGSAGVGSTLLAAAALAVDMVEENTDGGQAAYVLVNSSDRRALLNTKTGDMPAFLEVLGIDPGSFIASSTIPAGTVVAGAREAATFYELSGSPIRVEAVNVANGGVDGGVFGYYATVQNHDTGIVAVTFGA